MTIASGSSIAGFDDPERSIDASTFNSSYQALGTPLDHAPVILVIDNDTTVAVALSFTGTNTWKTFSSGTAIILDLRSNRGKPFDFTIPIGTQIYVRGAVGTGSFRFSLVYAK